MKPQRIVWHHTAINSVDPQFKRTNQYHESRVFPKSSLGFYVGYHIMVEPDGTIVRARQDDEMGAHDHGENQNSLGIALAGNFTDHAPTEQQAAAAARVVSEWCKKWKIPITRIEPHRWDDQTECPGKFLPDDWMVQQYLEREATIGPRLFWKLGKALGLL